ncbi:MAG: deoxyribodipyrimidine photo-lyase [Verrucomicrobiota bacterium]
MQHTECPVENKRIQHLNSCEIAPDREYVLYWMQKAQRVEFNPALEYAAWQARRQNKPLLVIFALTPDYPEAEYRHYRFMLEGLQDVQSGLKKRQIAFVLRLGYPPKIVLDLAEQATQVVCERAYLHHLRQWRREVAEGLDCRFTQVEGEVVVPVEQVSNKREYAARTIRSKITDHINDYLQPLTTVSDTGPKLASAPSGLDIEDKEKIETELNCPKTVSGVSAYYRGGNKAAKNMLANFIRDHLDHYASERNKPEQDAGSKMSMYLHFGHISPVWLALQIQAVHTARENRNAYLEELIVRRELSINFVQYTPDYDKFDCLPQWAGKTLAEHADDKREYVYSLSQLEKAATHDPYWNAAMTEMKITGYMHNYMRMYWGKKILEWTESPTEAFERVLHLNNKYFVDGRGPASFANVGWVFGLHDRPWKERAVFGKVRYMNAAGLERKCRINDYVKKIQKLG